MRLFLKHVDLHRFKWIKKIGRIWTKSPFCEEYAQLYVLNIKFISNWN